jgi:uncharacterized membrane protein YeiB
LSRDKTAKGWRLNILYSKYKVFWKQMNFLGFSLCQVAIWYLVFIGLFFIAFSTTVFIREKNLVAKKFWMQTFGLSCSIILITWLINIVCSYSENIAFVVAIILGTMSIFAILLGFGSTFFDSLGFFV